MDQTNARTPILLHRKNLVHNELKDHEVAGVLQTILNNAVGDPLVGGITQDTAAMISERFGFLSQVVNSKGYGEEPTLFNLNGCLNMEYIEYFAAAHNKDVTEVAKVMASDVERQIAFIQEQVAELREIAATKRYEPEEDEPSVFGLAPGHPSAEWLFWQSHRNSLSISDAAKKGKEIMDALRVELPRVRSYRGDSPSPLVEPTLGGVETFALYAVSFKYVIFLKYNEGITWEEAHHKALQQITR